jgi:hypothetical protein
MLDLQSIDWSLFRLAKSGRTIKLLYDKEAVQFCTSTLYTPFGVKSINKDWANFTEYNIDCSLNQASSETACRFREFLEKLDEKLLELVKGNASLFNNLDADNVLYTNILKENGNYPKLVRLQLPRDKNGNFQSFLFDENKDKIKVEEKNIEALLTKGKTFRTIVECSKIWFYNGKVGSIWNIVQLRFNAVEYAKESNEDNNSSNVYETLMIED